MAQVDLLNSSLKMVKNVEIAQNLSESLIRPTLQSEKKKTFGSQKKIISYCQASVTYISLQLL